MTDEQPPLACNFCKKTQKEVKKLIAGPSVYICDECVGLCNDIIAEEVEAQEAQEEEEEALETLAPGDLLARLDARVVGCAGPKRTLVASYRYQHALPAREDALAPRVLLVGPTGCGKTTLGRAFVSFLPIGFATDVSRLSETGYVGDDVEHVLWHLLDSVERDAWKAARGALFLDGVEKLGGRLPATRARDIAGGSVQRELLRLLDGALLSVPAGTSRHPHRKGDVEVATNRILVVAAVRYEGPALAPDATESQVRDALIEAGLLGAFVARFDRVVWMPPLGERELDAIAAGLLQEAARRAAAVGSTLTARPDATAALAAHAAKSAGGAWALRAPIHRILEEILVSDTPLQREVSAPDITTALR